MNLSNFKITDGDLILINVEGNNVTNDFLNNIRNRLEKWAKDRGLSNVEFMVSGGDIKMSIAKLSVNDVIENEVLSEK